MLASIENTFVDQLLKHLLDGNKGSNALGAVVVGLVGANVNWALALKGFRTQESAAELAKIAGAAVLGLYAFFVGRKKKENT